MGAVRVARETELGRSVVRWLNVPCMNPLCSVREHRRGMVSVDGGPWVVGLLLPDAMDFEEAEEALLEAEDLLQRQGVAFGCDWSRVKVPEIRRQLLTIEVLPGEAARYMRDCELEALKGLRKVCKRGDMSEALRLCGTVGVDVGGECGT